MSRAAADIIMASTLPHHDRITVVYLCQFLLAVCRGAQF